MRLDPGQRVGVYEILGSLGAGGMGEVYQARDTRLGRLVAIKFVSDDLAADHVASERLAREARLTSLLNHPNIVTVHDVGDLDGRPFIVMEFVAGQSLHSAIHRERLTPARVIAIAMALDPRHSRGWRERGRTLFRLGRLEEAEKAFRTAVTLDPDDWTARNGLGATLLRLNRLDEAISEFERMQALVPDNTRAYNNLGSAFLLQERFDKATEMYERSLSLDKNPTAYSNLGTALYQQGLYADAARTFEGAVTLPGAAFLHWFNLGAACYWADFRTRAKEASRPP